MFHRVLSREIERRHNIRLEHFMMLMKLIQGCLDLRECLFHDNVASHEITELKEITKSPNHVLWNITFNGRDIYLLKLRFGCTGTQD